MDNRKVAMPLQSPENWLISLIFGIIGSFFGIIAGAWKVLGKIDEGEKRIHQRIDLVRDEYLKKEDFKEALLRIEKSMEDTNTERKLNVEQINTTITREFANFNNRINQLDCSKPCP